VRYLNVFFTTVIVVLFLPGRVSASISGKVMYADGNGVSGALITFTDESDPDNCCSDNTDDAGRYEVSLPIVSVDDENPVSCSLGRNYPNPFNPTTIIPYSLDAPGHVTLIIYNVMGQTVRTLVDSYRSGGTYTALWDGRTDDGRPAAAGVYLYRLDVGPFGESRKMLLLDGGVPLSSSMAFPKTTTAGKPAAFSGTFRVTITGGDIVPYEKSGLSLVDGNTYDFTVSRKAGQPDIQLVNIPGGTFRMGSIQNALKKNELPVHDVTITGFEMSACEITNALYAGFLSERIAAGYVRTDGVGLLGDYVGKKYITSYSKIRYDAKLDSVVVEDGYEDHPMVGVSWYGAKAFAVHYGLDLPTEAEWEYACRAGTETRFYTGNHMGIDGLVSNDLSVAGWYRDNSGGTTHPTGLKEPNAWGLFDMHGNVWEWCSSWYDMANEDYLPSPYYSSSPAVDPPGISREQYKVLRGGGWRTKADGCRSSTRGANVPSAGNGAIGFRVVRRIPSHPLSHHTLGGRIIHDGTGLEGVEVHITEYGYEPDGTGWETDVVDAVLITDENGAFSIPLFHNVYLVSFDRYGYDFEQNDVKVHLRGDDVILEDIPATRQAIDSLEMAFATVPGGTFRMGEIHRYTFEKEPPVHEVTLPGFEIGVYEVINAQYAFYLNEAMNAGDVTVTADKVIGSSGAYNGKVYLERMGDYCDIVYTDGEFRVQNFRAKYPVCMVSWFGAKAFAMYYGYDLPTEAEWEYACRAGTETIFYTGDNIYDNHNKSYVLETAGWYKNNSWKCRHPVGQKEPNAWGLYDTHGNVFEWCHDWYGADYYKDSPVDNPVGPESGFYRVRRGGGWFSNANLCRSASRSMYYADRPDDKTGFRVVRRPDGVIH